MKALRYLLIAILLSMVSSLSAADASAQTLALQPEAQIHSTSTMVSSGSHLPQAAVEGTTTTYGEQAGPHKGNARRATLEDDGWEDDPDPDNPGEPFPIGDAAIPLALLALAYLIMRVVRKRSV